MAFITYVINNMKGEIEMFQIDSSRVRSEIFKRGLSTSEFARQVGLTETTARKLLRDGSEVQPKVIGALAKFFGVDGETLILKKG